MKEWNRFIYRIVEEIDFRGLKLSLKLFNIF